MKKLMLFALTIFFYSATFSQTKISIDSVSKYMGRKVTVCSKVYGVKSLEKVSFTFSATSHAVDVAPLV